MTQESQASQDCLPLKQFQSSEWSEEVLTSLTFLGHGCLLCFLDLIEQIFEAIKLFEPEKLSFRLLEKELDRQDWSLFQFELEIGLLSLDG